MALRNAPALAELGRGLGAPQSIVVWLLTMVLEDDQQHHVAERFPLGGRSDGAGRTPPLLLPPPEMGFFSPPHGRGVSAYTEHIWKGHKLPTPALGSCQHFCTLPWI